MQFSKRLDRFGDEIFAALNNRRMELEAQGMKIYNMSVGTPDFKTPEYIKKAVAEAAMMTTTGNTVSAICRSFWTQSVLIIKNVLMWN